MHICYTAIDFHDSMGGGGIASYTTSLGQELVRRGHRVTVIAKSPVQGLHERNGLTILKWPFPDLSWYLYRLHLFRDWLVSPLREIEWSWSIRRAVELI